MKKIKHIYFHLSSLLIFILASQAYSQDLVWKENSSFIVDSVAGTLESGNGGDANTLESYILSESSLLSNDTGYVELTDFFQDSSPISPQSIVNIFSLYFTSEDNFSLDQVHQNSYSLTYYAPENAVYVKGPDGYIDIIENVVLSTTDTFRIEKIENNKINLKFNTHEYLITDNYIGDGRIALRTNTNSLLFDFNSFGFLTIDTNPIINVTDTDKNWISSYSFDISGKLNSAAVNYFDCLSKPTQSQSIDFKTNKTWASETRYDFQGRPALQTFSSPLSGQPSSFTYAHDFILRYDETPLTTATLEANPEGPPVFSNSVGTVGWYYSNNNTLEPFQDISGGRPYVRTIYDELNPGKIRAVVGGKELDANSNGVDEGFLDKFPQGYTYSMSAAQELYYAFGKDYFYGPVNLNGDKEVILKSFKTVSIDAHGNEIVSFTDAEGKVLALARSGGSNSYQVVSTIGDQGYIDVHIPSGVTNSSIQFLVDTNGYTIWDLRTGTTVTTAQVTGGNIYRIEHANAGNDGVYITSGGQITYDAGSRGIQYPVNYYDYSLNYYDDSGSLQATTQPLGFDSSAFNLATGTPNHTMTNNFISDALGKLNETSTPDEGDAVFLYRSDGQIRFSRNSKQLANDEFSYTNYDDFGRPVESGASTSALPYFEALSTLTPTFTVQSRLTSGGGTISKTGSTWHTSGFISNENTGTGSFRVSFQLSKDDRGIVGISETNYVGNVNDQTSVEYGIYFRWNQVNIMNYGKILNASASLYTENDVFHIERIGDSIYFKKNSEILYTLNAQLTNPSYLIDGSLFEDGTVVSNILLEELDPNFIPVAPPVDDWVVDPLSCKEQLFTIYDIPDTQGLHALLYSSVFGAPTEFRVQRFTAGSVSKTYTKNPETTTTWYSYDIYGRVEWTVQFINGLGAKTIDYEYDDATGKITKVLYQKDDATERFIHKNLYNEVGQLITVETSRDNINFIEQARYFYYHTGELKRTLLAEGLQGIDYVYSLNGQLKAINHPGLTNTDDPGHDQNNAFGLILDYHKKDYTRSGTGINFTANGNDRFDGNLKAARWGTQGLGAIGTQNGFLFNYNENNWLTSATFGSVAGNIYSAPIGTPDYSVSGITYDANGNIQHLKRTRNYYNGSNAMDDLYYNYTSNSNQLTYVTDSSGNLEEDGDIKTQSSGNYIYNNIGELVENQQDEISYNYYANGLVNTIGSTILGNDENVKFFYNDRGHRVEKRVTAENADSQTFYVRDISGNVLATYLVYPNVNPIIEFPMYGLSRIGVADRFGIYKYELTDHLGNIRAVIQRDYTPQIIVNEHFSSNTVTTPPWHHYTNTVVTADNERLKAQVLDISSTNEINMSFDAIVHRRYAVTFTVDLNETANSLNYGIDTSNGITNVGNAAENGTYTFEYVALQGGTVDLYFSLNYDYMTLTNNYYIDNVRVTDISTNNTPVMLAYKDYYPFGMAMPDRNIEGAYRYAFQGQEKDSETGMEAFEARLWDARIGRWLTVDPASQFNSPYLGMANNPMNTLDPDGRFASRLAAWIYKFSNKLYGSEIVKNDNGKFQLDNIGGRCEACGDWTSLTAWESSPFYTAGGGIWNNDATRQATGDKIDISGSLNLGAWLGVELQTEASWILRGDDASFFPYLTIFPSAGGSVGVGGGADYSLEIGSGVWTDGTVYGLAPVREIEAESLLGTEYFVSGTITTGVGGTVEVSGTYDFNTQRLGWITTSKGITFGGSGRLEVGLRGNMIRVHTGGKGLILMTRIQNKARTIATWDYD